MKRLFLLHRRTPIFQLSRLFSSFSLPSLSSFSALQRVPGFFSPSSLSSVFSHLSSHGIPRDLHFFTVFLENLSARPSGASQASAALAIFERLAIEGIKPDTRCLNALMKNFIKSGDLSGAVNVLSLFGFHGLRPDEFSLQILLSAGQNFLDRQLFSSQKLGIFIKTVWLDLKRMGISPNTTSYSTLIRSCGSVGEVEFALALHNEWQLLGNSFDLEICSALVHACVGKKEYYAKAFDFYELALANSGDPRQPAMVKIFLALLKGAGEFGDVANSVLLLKQMKESGIPRDLPVYNFALQAIATSQRASRISIGQRVFSQDERIDMGQKIFEQMKNSGVQPNEETLNQLVNIRARALRLNSAMAFCSAVHEEFAIAPSSQTLINLLRMFSRAQRLDGALEILEKLKQAGHLKKEAYRILLVLCRRLGAIERGREILQEMKKLGFPVSKFDAKPFQAQNSDNDIVNSYTENSPQDSEESLYPTRPRPASRFPSSQASTWRPNRRTLRQQEKEQRMKKQKEIEFTA